MATRTPKLMPLSNELSAQIDALPLWGTLPLDASKREWTPSTSWHRYVQGKLGKQFSFRRYGDTVLLLRIK